jgi:hypothetical protein
MSCDADCGLLADGINVYLAADNDTNPTTVTGATVVGNLLDVDYDGPKSDIKTLKRPLNSSSKYVCKKLASIDAGEAKFTINFKKAAFAAWLTLVSSGARKWLIIVLPDGPDETTTGGSMLLLRGFASGPGLSAGGSGEEVTSPCMFTVTCEPVFIPGEDEE